MKRCTRCIMPDSVPGITFDENGICSHCHSYVVPEPRGDAEFARIVDTVRGKGHPYECIVPLSGGRDSTFVLYLAKAVYGLRTLAVNADNEFRNDQAVRNMKSACEALGVDLREVRSNRHIGRKIVAANVRTGIPLGLPALVDSFCRHCTYGYRSAVYIEALRCRVPLVLWGASSAESTAQTRNLAVQGIKRSRYHKLLNPNLYRTELLAFLQRLEFHVPGNPVFSRGTPRLLDPSITEISVFDCISWNRREIKETITTKLGWEKPTDHVSTWRTDCRLHEIVNYLWVKLVGCSWDCMGFCNMILAGQMEREEALREEEQIIATCSRQIDELLALVGLNKEEAGRIKAMTSQCGIAV